MNIIEQRERNQLAREGVEKLHKEVGIMYKSIGKQIGIDSSSSFTQWKKSIYDFGEDRLEQVESLINKYV